MKLSDIPRKYRKLYITAMKGKSRKAAIRFFCLECTGFIESETRVCSDKGCVLYKFRNNG